MTDLLEARSRALRRYHDLIGAAKSRRSQALIASFPHSPEGHRVRGNFALGWAFAIGPWFNDALDIKFVSGAWTQGSAFNFRTGYTMYDLPKAYDRPEYYVDPSEYKAWAGYLEEATVFLQVEDARPAIPVTKDADREPGFARVSIHVPTKDRRQSLTVRTHDFSQDELVAILIRGVPDHLVISKG